MKRFGNILVVVLVAISLPACAMKHKKVEESLETPINCATAEADIRVLEQEKVHVAQQIASGVTAIVPISLVVGVITRTERTKIRVATGKYNTMIDERITEIKNHCGIE